MGCFQRNWPVLSCIFVWSVAILRTTDGGSITWYEPPPFETITDATITSSTNKSLTKGFINEELSCNFSLTADLSIITVTMSLEGVTAATYVPSPPELSVDGRFESRFNASWIPTKLTLIVFNVTTADKGQYSCSVLTSGGGIKTWTRNVQVAVLGPPEGIKFHVSEEEVCNGTTISFSCSAEMANPMELNYQLYENNVMIGGISSTGVWNKTMTVGGVFVYKCMVNNSVGTAMSSTVSVTVNVSSSIQTIPDKVFREDDNVTLFCNVSGIPQPLISWINVSNDQRTHGNELTIEYITRYQAGEYRCEATNPCRNATKSTAIDVHYPPEGIQFHVSEEDVCNGTTVSFNCSAETANPMELNYQLYENNMMIGVISSTGVWNKTMTVGGVFVYKCEVNNSVGTAMSSTVSVNVNVSSFIMPISEEVTEGGNLTLSCHATGIPPPTVFWVNTSNGERTNGTKLFIRNIRRSEAGEYRCEVTNPCGNAAESPTIDVQYPPEGIQLHVSEGEVCNGTTISFNCSAETANPMEVNYQLYENNVMIGVISSTGVWSKTMTVGGVFVYKCMVNNSVGTAMSSTVSVTVSVSSSIQTIPDKVVREGGNVTLFCNASGIPQPLVYWINVSNDQRTHGNELAIENITRYEAGEYRCEATNPCRNATKSTTIVVHYNPDTVRLVANTTENRNCSDFLLVNFTCDASEANPPVENYQLLKSQVTVETSSNWTWIRNISSEGDHTYSCRALHSLGNVISSNHVTVTLNGPVQVHVHVKSGNETVTEGGNVSVYCDASAGYPKPSFSWLNLNTSELIPGQWLTFINISKEKAGDYICNASNTCGEKQSSVTTIDVQYKPENVHLITSSRKICAGKMVILTCSAGDSNPLAKNFTLYKKGLRLANVTREHVGVFNQMLYTQGQHSYSCVASNAIGNASSSNSIVEVEVPVQISVHVQSGSETLPEGGNVSLHCSASGYAEGTVTWTKLNADDLILSRQWLNFTFISRGDSGEYICNANNTCGKNRSSVRTIDVQYKPENVHLNTSSRKICAGKMVILTCSAGESNPAVESFTLYKKGLRLANVTRAHVGVFNQMLYTQGQHSFSCVASNAIGNASSSNTIVEVEVPASVTVENRTIVVREGDNVTLHCMSSGFPRPNVSWVNNSNYILEAGSILNLTNIRRHNREYNCSASNACGNDSRQFYIDVQYAAEATGRGGNYSVREGSTELFSCPVDGNPEPNITWYKGSDVTEPGISNAKQLEAGETGCYTCSAINGLGPPVTITQCLVVEPEEPTPTGQPTNQVNAELTMIEEFVSEYRDLNNQVSKQLVDSFVLEMDKVYQNDDNYIRTEVTGLRSGSVIVSFILYFKNSVTPNEGVKELQAAISNGTLGTYQVGNLTLLSSGVSTFTTTPRTAEPPDRPTWIIIVAVAAGVVLLALVVAFVTWWVHKKRKCIKDTKIHNSECEESLHGDSPHAKTNRAYAEAGPPSAGTEGAARQQSQDPGAIPTYAVVDKSKKKKKAEEKPPIYASVDKSKKRKKKTDDKNLYDSVEEPKKEKKPGEVLYAELGDFQNPAMPEVPTSPATLPPLKRPPSSEQTQYADITAFLKGDATLPQKEGNEGSEMQQQSANQSQHDVDNKETPM